MRSAAPWVLLGAATAALALALGAAGLESPTLFSALLVGIAFALARPAPPGNRTRRPTSTPPGWARC